MHMVCKVQVAPQGESWSSHTWKQPVSVPHGEAAKELTWMASCVLAAGVGGVMGGGPGLGGGLRG